MKNVVRNMPRYLRTLCSPTSLFRDYPLILLGYLVHRTWPMTHGWLTVTILTATAILGIWKGWEYYRSRYESEIPRWMDQWFFDPASLLTYIDRQANVMMTSIVLFSLGFQPWLMVGGFLIHVLMGLLTIMWLHGLVEDMMWGLRDWFHRTKRNIGVLAA